VLDTHLENYDPQSTVILSIAEIHGQRIYALESAVTWHSEYPGVVHLSFRIFNAKISQSPYKLCPYGRNPPPVVKEVTRAAQAKNSPVDASV
jgi:hypothetical protein